MSSGTDAYEPGTSVNAALCVYLQQQLPPSITHAFNLDALARFPLPALTGAILPDIASTAVASKTAQSNASCPTVPEDKENKNHAANTVNETLGLANAAIHRFWHTHTVATSSHAMSPSFSADRRCNAELTGSSAAHSSNMNEHNVSTSWARCSPFRVCADPAFHHQLRRSAGVHLSSRVNTQTPTAPTEPPSFFKGSSYSLIDRLCHGLVDLSVGSNISSSNSQIGDGGARRITEGGVQARSQKRQRTEPQATTVSVSQQLQNSAARGVRIDGDNRTADRCDAEEGARSVASALSTSLHARVHVNDDLLDMLLGVSTPTTHADTTAEKEQADTLMNSRPDDVIADTDKCRKAIPQTHSTPPLQSHLSPLHTEPRQCTTHTSHSGSVQFSTATAGSPPPTLGDDSSYSELALAGCSVKELRDRCVRLGLLSTGSKSILQQRIARYEASVRDKNNAAVAPSSSQLPPVSSASADVFSQTRQVATAVTGTTAASRLASGSPPRTVFRYRSPSLPCSGTPPPPLLDSTSTTGSSFAAAPQAPAAGELQRASGVSSEIAAVCPSPAPVTTTTATAAAARAARRLVPSPVEFVQELMQQHKETTTSSAASDGGAGGRCTVCTPAPSPAASRAHDDRLKQEMAAVTWKWLVDFRERAGGHRGGRSKHDGMMDAFRKQQVPCASVMLPSGDFMLTVELSDHEIQALESARDPHTEQCPEGSAEHGSQGGTMPTQTLSTTPAPTSSDEAPLSHVCSIVVERKTAADLDASVKGSRYTEQRRLLTASPYSLVVWLIEGTDVGTGGGGGGAGRFAKYNTFFRSHICRRGNASRSPSPVPSQLPDGSSDVSGTSSAGSPASPTSPADSARLRVDSACASLGLHQPGWCVVRTRNTAESVSFLKQLALQVVRQLAEHRLCRRAARPDECHAVSLVNVAGPRSDATGLSDALTELFRGLPSLHEGGIGGAVCNCGQSSHAHSCTPSLRFPCRLLRFARTPACLQRIGQLQRHLRAQTAFPRMLLCVRGCSPGLAALLSGKYGSLMGFWKALRARGREACDADPDIRRLSTAQKKVFILLTEFLLAKDYY